jgi:formate hydrogenlyase subunit 6/NADH:ubiquinone oxidoreductase subunit I
MSDTYSRLAKYLDYLPAGFPPTGDGLELQILKKLFTEHEAALALHLSLLNQDAALIAHQAGLELEQATQLLDGMVHKGLISGNYPEGKSPSYSIDQFVIGFYEGQVNRLDAEFVELVEAYMPFYFEHGPWKKLPQIRTIPINQAIPITSEVMPYMQVEAILRSKGQIAVRNCVCRQERELLGDGCSKPMEVCLSFDGAAMNTVKTGKGRMISLEEALDILKDAQQAGLVLQPANSQNPIYMCACCSCCCGVLRHIKEDPNPGSLVANPYIAHYDSSECITCGACVEICPMNALTLNDEDRVTFEPGRCIGCGLCVGVCPTGAVTLTHKPGSEQPKIPKDTTSTYVNIAKAQGIGKLLVLLKMLMRSVIWEKWMKIKIKK